MKRLVALLSVLILVWPVVASADAGPVVPCGADEPAPYPAFAAQPNVRSWRTGDIDAGWAPAACLGWASQRFTVLTALAGSFHFDGSADDLLARFGAQSAWRGMEYWSVTAGRRDTLIADAAALDSSNRQQRRADFTILELKSGADLYFMQEYNRSSGAVTYRMRVRAIDPDRLVVTIENTSAVSFLVFTLFDPGDLQSAYIFVKRAPAVWGYYSLSRAREGAAMIGNHAASYRNRATAIYRYLAGIPGDWKRPLAH